MTDSADIFVRVGADIDPLKKNLKSGVNSLNQFGAKARSTANIMGKVAAASAVAATAIGVKLVSGSLSAIDAQAKLARMLGTSSASLATLDRASEMAGISMKSIETGAKNLEVALGEAAQGTGEAVETLNRLGLTARDLEGMTLDAKIMAINTAIGQNIPKTEQAAAAADLFGKKAGFAIRQLTPEGIAEAARQMSGFGLAITDVDAAKIEAANDAMGSIGRAVEGVSQQLTIELAPILEAVAESFQEAAIESGGFKTQSINAVSAVASAVGFLGNSIHGVKLIIGGLELGFKATSVAVSIFFTQTIESIDAGIQYAMATINNLIGVAANNLPGIDIEKLIVGKSALAESLRAGTDAAKEELSRAATELNNKILGPLPSEQVEAFMASIHEKNALEVQAELAKNATLSAIDQEEKALAVEREKTFGQKITEIKKAWGNQQTSAVGQMFSDLATLTQSGSKKQFEIGKMAARANVVLSTYEGAQKAYTALSGIPIVGPGLGIAAAGAAVAAGGIRLSAINSTSFGGGGLAGSGAGAATPASSVSNTAPTGAGGSDQSRTIRLEGIDSNKSFSGGQVQQLAEQLVELQSDGFVLVI